MGTRGRVTLCLLVAALILAAPVPVAGAEKPPEVRRQEIGSELERLRSELDETVAEEAGLLAELAVSRRTATELAGRVALLDRQVAVVGEELAGAERDLTVAQTRVALARRRLDAATRLLDDARRQLRDQAVAAFVGHGSRAPQLDLILQVGDMRELHEVMTFVGVVAAVQDEIVRGYAVRRGDIEHLAADLATAEEEAAGRRDLVAGRKAELEAARGDQERARAAVAAEAAIQEQLLVRARAQRGAHERRISELRRESDSITELLRRRQARQGVTLSGRGVLASPLASPRVTSGFGYRTHPIYGSRRLHAGIDFGAVTGTPVLAARDGVVVSTGTRGGYGETVLIDHGGALATLSAHLSRIDVRPGQQVRTGQVIGAVGSTGFSTGPHLHFEVRISGTPVNPLSYL